MVEGSSTVNLLIFVIVLMPIIYTIVLFLVVRWFMRELLRRVEDIQLAIMQIPLTKAGLESVIEDTGHSLDYVSRDLNANSEKIGILTLRMGSLEQRLGMLGGAIQSLKDSL